MYSIKLLLFALRTMTGPITAATELFAETRSFAARGRKPAGDVRAEDSWRRFS